MCPSCVWSCWSRVYGCVYDCKLEGWFDLVAYSYVLWTFQGKLSGYTQYMIGVQKTSPHQRVVVGRRVRFQMLTALVALLFWDQVKTGIFLICFKPGSLSGTSPISRLLHPLDKSSRQKIGFGVFSPDTPTNPNPSVGI